MMKLVVCFFVVACMLPAQEREALTALNKAQKFVDSDPAASLSIAENAAAADWSRRKWFWPVMLQAEVKLAKWESAERLGSEAVKEIDAGRLFEHADEIGDEVRFRRLFAETLEHRSRAEDARVQRRVMETRAKAATLAAEIREPAPPQLKFAMPYKGRVAIVLYWATWCAPCIGELDQLNEVYAKLHARAEIVAVSADDSATVIAAFAKKRGYAFSAIASKEALSTIPQLFVLDREGTVRFHIRGFDDDGLFMQRLDWMVEAALK
jgi:thiol-disulfide isomerase/thioredoxin